MIRILCPTIVLLLAAGCGTQPADTDPHAGHDHPPGEHDHADGDGHDGHDHAADDGHDDDRHDHGEGDHEDHALSVELAGASYTVTLHGAVAAGGEAHADIVRSGPATAALRAWVGVEGGRGSMKALVEFGAADTAHAHIMAPDPLPEGSALWLEASDDAGERSTASVPLPEIRYTAPEGHSHEDGHDHAH